MSLSPSGNINSRPVILGSRSPRRRELLSLLVPAERILVRPPRESAEPGFSGLRDENSIRNLLLEIARSKARDVCGQCETQRSASGSDAGSESVPIQHEAAPWVLCADTVIVATAPDGRPIALEQPPTTPGWQHVVRQWFLDYYAGREHQAITALCVVDLATGVWRERTVSTRVTIRADLDDLLDWYLATSESLGKAGGYALQGAGSLLISEVRGSLSNVIGLPLEALRELLLEAGCLQATACASEPLL